MGKRWGHIEKCDINMTSESMMNARAAQQGMRRSGMEPQKKRTLNDMFSFGDGMSLYDKKNTASMGNNIASSLDSDAPMTKFTPANKAALDQYMHDFKAQRTTGSRAFGDKWGGIIGEQIGSYFGGPIGSMMGQVIGEEAGGEIVNGFDEVFHEAPGVAKEGLEEFGDFVSDIIPGGGGGNWGGSWKIVCTAMNDYYGFGKFRQTIWLKHSATLHPAYEKGYHTLFLPLVALAYKKQIPIVSKITQIVLEHIARHRTIDIRAEMRNNKRDILGRLYRAILEPICYFVGKWKSNERI